MTHRTIGAVVAAEFICAALVLSACSKPTHQAAAPLTPPATPSMAQIAPAPSAASVEGAAKPKAASPAYSVTYQKCMDDAGGVTSDMLDCMGAETKAWDDRLNAAYKRLMASLPADQASALRNDQRRWIRNTKTKCEHAGDAEEGGTLQTVEIEGCYLGETAKKAADLEGR